MRTAQDIIQFIEQRPEMMRVLALVEELLLPDCWVGAGFVRNAVWDALCGRAGTPTDVDVVFFAPENATAARDMLLEEGLRMARPDIEWDVKNQARMHLRNGAAPYRNCEEAIACWPETATAIAVRKNGDHVEMLAPHGVVDLLGLVVRPTPAFSSKADEVVSRVNAKGWPLRWSRLTVRL